MTAITWRTPEEIKRDFQYKVCEKIRLIGETTDHFRIFAPYVGADGDHLDIVLKREGATWTLTDEGHMHMMHDLDGIDLQGILFEFHIEDRKGELLLRVTDENFGEAIYSFVQALAKITTERET